MSSYDKIKPSYEDKLPGYAALWSDTAIHVKLKAGMARVCQVMTSYCIFMPNNVPNFDQKGLSYVIVLIDWVKLVHSINTI